MQSALEQEFSQFARRLRLALIDRDRAVVAAVLLCCVPVLPITLIGLVLTVVNLVLLALGRLPRRELPPLLFGLLMAGIYLTGWFLLLRAIASGALVGPVWHWLRSLLPVTTHPRALTI